MVTSPLPQPDVRVLVVHSDPADLAVLASVVAAHGFELRVLESCERLTAEVVRFQPDAVVLDVKQRAADGYELCLALKSDPITAGVAVILTGSLDGPEARRRAFAAGCDDFLEKPIQRHVLAYRLRSFARLRRAWLRDAPTQPLLTVLNRFVEAHRQASGSSAEIDEAHDRLLRACRGVAADAGLTPPQQAALEQAALMLASFERWLAELEPA